MGLLVEYSRTVIGAGGVGLILALTYLAAEYLVLPAWRLRAERCRGPLSVAELIGRERLRLRRISDLAAVLEEHGRSSEAVELRAEAELRALLLARVVPRGTGHQLRSWPSSRPGPRRY